MEKDYDKCYGTHFWKMLISVDVRDFRYLIEIMTMLYLLLSETGAVFTFGKSRFADNVPNKFWIRNDRVLQVACGDEHTALVAGKYFLVSFPRYGF